MPRKPLKFKEMDSEGIKVIEEGDCKDYVRSKIYNSILHTFSTKKKIRGLTLPATGYILEQQLIEQYKKKVSFVCLERSKKIYNESNKTAKFLKESQNIDIKLLNTDDLKYFKKNEDKFDFMWLDYCGAWSKSKEESIDKIFKKEFLNITNKTTPILGLTLTNGNEQYKYRELLDLSANKDYIGKDGLYNIRVDGIPKAINNIATKYNRSVYPKEIFYYRDKARNKNAQGLLVFIFWILDGIENLEMFKTSFTELRKRQVEINLS